MFVLTISIFVLAAIMEMYWADIGPPRSDHDLGPWPCQPGALAGNVPIEPPKGCAAGRDTCVGYAVKCAGKAVPTRRAHVNFSTSSTRLKCETERGSGSAQQFSLDAGAGPNKDAVEQPSQMEESFNAKGARYIRAFQVAAPVVVIQTAWIL